MARSKKRNFAGGIQQPESGHYHAKLPAYSLASKKPPLPSDPDLLENIVRALLTRMGWRDKQEARQIYLQIRMLQVAEEMWNQRPTTIQVQHPDMALDDWCAYYGERFYQIAFNKKSQETHWPPALRIQRDLLETALREAVFGINSTYPEKEHEATRLRWLKENGKELDDLIRKIPCFCTYRISVVDMPQKVLGKATTVNALVTAILAGLHSTTEQEVKKKAKSSGIMNDDLPVWSPCAPKHRPGRDIERALTPPFFPFDPTS